MKTRITELLGIEHPIFQAAMSWASSNAPLVIAVSNAGGMGVLAAGPMRPGDFQKALHEIKKSTAKPYGVNIPLNSPRAPELLEISFQEKIPVMVASQGGPREHLTRFRAIGTKWLHVVASVEHASKAEATFTASFSPSKQGPTATVSSSRARTASESETGSAPPGSCTQATRVPRSAAHTGASAWPPAWRSG